MHQYYVKVVPTVYSYLDGSTREVWQYSVTEHVRHVTPGSGRGLPGVFFFYEVSPLVAEFEERRQGWRALLTGLAAIVGGVHATAHASVAHTPPLRKPPNSGRDLCGNQNFTARSSSSTPSTRRLLDGVTVPVPVHPTHWLISTQVQYRSRPLCNASGRPIAT